jgi:ankyrin repeat protein
MISASELNERMRVAAEDGNEEEVHALIERGADIQHKDDYGLTSLILACCEGHLDIAQLLIERGEI